MSKVESKKRIYDKARKGGYAIGAFNVFNMITAEAVVEAANEIEMPVILQMSMTVAKIIGIKKATAMLKAVTAESKTDVFFHLDHCTDTEIAKACILEGWESIMFDGSHYSFEENVRLTKEIVDFGKMHDVIVEGEIGLIQGVEDHVSVEEEKLTSADEVRNFIEKSGIFTVAPSIGTAHGIYNGTPTINYDLVNVLSKDVNHPVVIHGGTGLEYEDYQKLVRSGASKINVSTAIKHAYIDTMKRLARTESSYDPFDYEMPLREGVKRAVLEKMDAFTYSDI